jgi:hypothetical protein
LKRRKALKGIAGLTGITFVSFAGTNYFLGNPSPDSRDIRDYADIIAELVEIIIPTTTSPGAKDALVQDYVISYMEDCSSSKEYNNFLNGLIDLQEKSMNIYAKPFEQCSVAQQIRLLEGFDNHWTSGGLWSKINNRLRGRSFFDLLKTLTIEGYCTSQVGATQHLVYRPIPGQYKAVTILRSDQRAWATK